MKNPRLATLFLLFLSMVGSSLSQELDMPLTEEDAIMMRELEWAEKAMEGYKRKTGIMPIRSTIRAAHVHTEAWRQESFNLVSASGDYASEDTNNNLRGRMALGGDR
jgi:hypothetical protein